MLDFSFSPYQTRRCCSISRIAHWVVVVSTCTVALPASRGSSLAGWLLLLLLLLLLLILRGFPANQCTFSRTVTGQAWCFVVASCNFKGSAFWLLKMKALISDQWRRQSLLRGFQSPAKYQNENILLRLWFNFFYPCSNYRGRWLIIMQIFVKTLTGKTITLEVKCELIFSMSWKL